MRIRIASLIGIVAVIASSKIVIAEPETAPRLEPKVRGVLSFESVEINDLAVSIEGVRLGRQPYRCVLDKLSVHINTVFHDVPRTEIRNPLSLVVREIKIGFVSPNFGIRPYINVVGRRLPHIAKANYDPWFHSLFDARDYCRQGEDISAQFPPGIFRGHFDGFFRNFGGTVSSHRSFNALLDGLPRFIKGSFDKEDADSSYGNATYRNDGGNHCPFRHLPLGIKVLLGAPLIPIGLWIGWQSLLTDNLDGPWLPGAAKLIFGGFVVALGAWIMIV